MGARQRGQQRFKNSPFTSQNQSSSSLHAPTPISNAQTHALNGWQSYAHSYSQSAHNGFSLSQAARNTDSHGQSWSTSSPLRGKAISFVSAGNLKMEDDPVSKEDFSEDSRTKEVSHTHPTEADVQNTAVASEILPTESIGQDADDVDTEIPKLEALSFRQRVDSMSTDSGAEEIVFTGRQKDVSAKTTPPRTPHQAPEESEAAFPDPKLETYLPARTSDEVFSKPPLTDTSSLLFVPQSTSRQRKHSRRRGRARSLVSKQRRDEQEAIMQDYIDNMALDDEDKDQVDSSDVPSRRNNHFRYYDGTVEEHVKVQTVWAEAGPNQDLKQAQEWSSGDLEDFDGISTTDEEIMQISKVLRKRERPSGLQYLVSAIHADTSEAKWILNDRITSTDIQQKIEKFEVALAIPPSEEVTTSSPEDDEAEDDLIEKLNSEDEENERIMRHTARMTDEQIARVLAKQEELGMTGDEVLLFDGAAGTVDEDDETDDADDFTMFSLTQHISNRTRSKRNKRGLDVFPSAGAFADALDQDPYGGFDVMDYDRPSLRPRRKGRKGDLPFDPTTLDEDIAQVLQDSWSRDRERKAIRKREKAEAKQIHLVEHAKESEPETIKNAIRMFLVQEAETLSLPEMPSQTRASVHRLAKALILKSASQGKGDHRHPVLTKTPNTPLYTLETIWEVDNLMNQRKFFPKFNTTYGKVKGAKVQPSGGRMRRGGGGAAAGATYMDGDVVGASAPEIPAENKGRAMLERMGWSSGMGIGAIGNKGGTDVIKHVVKNTKAGLG